MQRKLQVDRKGEFQKGSTSGILAQPKDRSLDFFGFFLGQAKKNRAAGRVPARKSAAADKTSSRRDKSAIALPPSIFSEGKKERRNANNDIPPIHQINQL